MIVERLGVDDEKGFKGNNRVGDGTDYYYDSSLLEGTFIFGLGYNRIEKINGGKGWKDNSDYENQIRGNISSLFLLLSFKHHIQNLFLGRFLMS